eukprot:gene17529-biopygen5026
MHSTHLQCTHLQRDHSFHKQIEHQRILRPTRSTKYSLPALHERPASICDQSYRTCPTERDRLGTLWKRDEEETILFVVRAKERGIKSKPVFGVEFDCALLTAKAVEREMFTISRKYIWYHMGLPEVHQALFFSSPKPSSRPSRFSMLLTTGGGGSSASIGPNSIFSFAVPRILQPSFLLNRRPYIQCFMLPEDRLAPVLHDCLHRGCPPERGGTRQKTPGGF